MYISAKSLDRRGVLGLLPDTLKREPANVCIRTSVARFGPDSGRFDLVFGFAFFVETSRVHSVHRVR